MKLSSFFITLLLSISIHTNNQATCTEFQNIVHIMMMAGGGTLSLAMTPLLICLQKKQYTYQRLVTHMTNEAQRDFSIHYNSEWQCDKRIYASIGFIGGLIFSALGTVLHIVRVGCNS